MLPGRAAVKQRPRLVWPEQPPSKKGLLLTLDGTSGFHGLALKMAGREFGAGACQEKKGAKCWKNTR